MDEQFLRKVPYFFIITILCILLISVIYSGPSITGQITAKMREIYLDMVVENNSIYLLNELGLPEEGSCIKVSGRVIGEGDVTITVEDSEGNEALIYQRKERSRFMSVTGMIKGDNKPSKNILLIKEGEESCNLRDFDPEKLVLEIEEGTSVYIEKIFFSTN